MKDDKTEWIATQVPDGTDWIEFMVNQPDPADLHLAGVMNHISLGVADIKKAQATLEAHGWKPHGDEKAQTGQRRQMATQPLRSGLHARGADGIQTRAEALLLGVHGPHPSE